jgi:hypothetical protein
MAFRISEKASRIGLYFMTAYVAVGVVVLYNDMKDKKDTAYGYNKPPKQTESASSVPPQG